MAASVPTHAFLAFFTPLFQTISFPSDWLLSHITIVETMESGERGMIPVAMTIINPRKEILSELGIEPATLFSQFLCATDRDMELGGEKVKAKTDTWDSALR